MRNWKEAQEARPSKIKDKSGAQFIGRGRAFLAPGKEAGKDGRQGKVKTVISGRDEQKRSRNEGVTPEGVTPEEGTTRSDNKIMRLVPKKIILFIRQLQCGHLQSTFLLHAYTFPKGTYIACSISRTQLLGCHWRPAIQPSGCLLLTQNGVLSLLILLF